ncbi:hypothetical protein M3703_04375 [Mannheimia haemolytica]|uniref:hypothetical protein n=1 Tax=Mannheimia haemolytica TaxID=75985 RepID=UPI00201C5EFE|nr:hypothetical protein [Mannheimia haemolytica]UQX80559.1 hypothetical protein M3703_04375 [Mannheimia haemolytica]
MVWLRKFAGIGKFLFTLVAVLVLVFVIGHFGLQYGIEAGEVPQFLERTWLLWLVVRWSLYAVSGWFLYKIRQFAKNKEDLTACKRLIRIAMLAAICIEIVVFTRLLGG